MLLTRILGLAILLLGLFLVGVSGDNHRLPNARAIAFGASLMAVGVLVAIFAADLELLIGWFPA
jgi:hypothetical protein